MKLDAKNGNTLWQDAIDLEFKIDEYETFKDLGHNGTVKPATRRFGYHLIFDAKHDGRRKARLVAGH